MRKAGGRDLVFVSCLTPQDYMTKTTVPEEARKLGASKLLKLSAMDITENRQEFL